MTSYERYVYELTYSIADTEPELYEKWLQRATEQWIATETVDGFRCERSPRGLCSHVRLVFEFETLADWAVFVSSKGYRHHAEQLRSMTDSVSERLWEPTPIQLGAGSGPNGSVAVGESQETK